MRGGADGLSLCVPFGDADYYTARPTIAVARPDSSAEFASVCFSKLRTLMSALPALFW